MLSRTLFQNMSLEDNYLSLLIALFLAIKCYLTVLISVVQCRTLGTAWKNTKRTCQKFACSFLPLCKPYINCFFSTSLPSFTEKSQAVVSESQHFQPQLNSYTLFVFRDIPLRPALTHTFQPQSGEAKAKWSNHHMLYMFRHLCAVPTTLCS